MGGNPNKKQDMISDEIEAKFKEYVEKAKFSTFDELATQFVEDLTERQLKYLVKKGIDAGWLIPVRRGEYEYKEIVETKPDLVVDKPAEQTVVSVEQKTETKPEPIVDKPVEQKKEEIILPETKKEEPKEPKKEILKKEEPKKEEPDFLTKKRKEIEDLQVRKKKIVEEVPTKKLEEPEEPKKKKEKEKSFPWIWIGVAIAGVVAVILFLKVFILGKKEQPRSEKQEEEKGVLDNLGVMNAEDLFRGR